MPDMDMDDLAPDTVRRRAWETIASVAETKARLAERPERRRSDGNDFGVPIGSPKRRVRVSAPQRPEGRDWAAEAVWVTPIVDGKIAALKHEITEALGEVIAGERTAAIDAVRAKIRAAIAADGSEFATRLAHISAGLEHPDRCLARIAKADAALGLSRADIGLMPN
jgi:hypothetical protein